MIRASKGWVYARAAGAPAPRAKEGGWRGRGAFFGPTSTEPKHADLRRHRVRALNLLRSVADHAPTAHCDCSQAAKKSAALALASSEKAYVPRFPCLVVPVAAHTQPRSFARADLSHWIPQRLVVQVQIP